MRVAFSSTCKMNLHRCHDIILTRGLNRGFPESCLYWHRGFSGSKILPRLRLGGTRSGPTTTTHAGVPGCVPPRLDASHHRHVKSDGQYLFN